VHQGEKEEAGQTRPQWERPVRRAILVTALVWAESLLWAGAAQAVAPTLGAVSAVNIEGDSATLKGTVDPEGLETTSYFEYSTHADLSGASRSADWLSGSGTVPEAIGTAISGLNPKTTYYYRLVATNSSGSTTGPAKAFTTTKGFGFLTGTSGFAVSALEKPAVYDGEGNLLSPAVPASVAGSHPYQLSFRIGLSLGSQFEGNPATPFPDGDIRHLHIDQPPGLIENPSVMYRCTSTEFHKARQSPYEVSLSGERCPERTQVGTVDVQTSRKGGEKRRFGVFNLVPEPAVPAQLGFSPYGSPVVLDLNLNGDEGSQRITLDAEDIGESLDIYGLDLHLWGVPWETAHDGERGNCLNAIDPKKPWCKAAVISWHTVPKEPNEEPLPCEEGTPGCVLDSVPPAYLTLPHRCSGPLPFAVRAVSWRQQGEASSSAVNRGSEGIGQQIEMGSCFASFQPLPLAQLNDIKASSPSGFNFRLEVDNSDLTNPKYPAPVPIKRAVVQLPEGVTVNPSVGAGLGVCTPGQYAAESPYSHQGDACPNSSKIGDFKVRSPLLEEFFTGAIYLAQPDDPTTAATGAENPFDTLIAVYLVARIGERGALIRTAGKIVADPRTGRLTATFDNLPQLPYGELDLTFRTGQRAFLVTPPLCGPAASTTDLTPWAGNGSVHAVTNSQISKGINRGPCPSGPLPFKPRVVAGGINSQTNAFTPYFIHLIREDTEQEITSYSLVLPKGITGKLAGIPYCSDAAIDAARGRQGFSEAAVPSCPVASEVGRVVNGYGVGSSLTYTTGRIYLAGPYHGRPLSLVFINPATVGPFDMGNVVIRSAFSIDERSARLEIDSSASDRIPHILDGIPLHLRDVRVYLDRRQFTHNPSSCAPSKMISTLTGSGSRLDDPSDDSSSTSSVHFQLSNCRTIGFRPSLRITLRGGIARGAYPELRAAFVARGQRDSNLKEITVSMPHAEFFAQQHIRGICSRAQFNAENCPADTAYGSVSAFTPLFDKPLRGPVYLRSSGGQIPDLVASLRSGAVHIVLEGAIGSTKKGGIRVRFEELPDQPLEKFVMVMDGGRRGLLQNSTDICAAPPIASIKALGQNNRGVVFTSQLRGQCKKKRGRR
jgi:hypothetical protein